MLSLSLCHNSKSIKWIVVYRPLDSSPSSFIDEFIVLIRSFSTDNFIILVDFNILINKSHIYSTKLFKSILTRNSLFQHITFPTHILGNTLAIIIT